jgi:hypothetical protein
MKNSLMIAFALVSTAAVAQTAEAILKNDSTFSPELKERWMKAIEAQCAQVLLKVQ